MNWIKKNGVTALLIALLVLMIVSPDAKAWMMRQIASTGLLNSKIKEAPKETAMVENATLKPSFGVADTSGKQISTSELSGKVVFINFWASWCPPCRAEFPSIQQFYDKYKTNPNVVFFTVNMDDNPELGKRYLQKENLTVPFLVPSSDIPQEFFSGALPTTVVLDKKGNIRLHHGGLGDYSTKTFYSQIDGLLAE